MKFINRNVNPSGKRVADCVTRALTTLLDKDYDDILRIQFQKVLESHECFYSMELAEEIMKDYGFNRVKVPRKKGNKCYKVEEIGEIIDLKKHKKILVSIRSHLTVIEDGNLIDIWDCRDSAICRIYIK